MTNTDAPLSPTPPKVSLASRLPMLAATVLLPVAVFSYLFFIAMKIPLNDPDLWWHLRTGQYVLEHGDVPKFDPFSFTSPNPLNESQRIGLRGQWLGQVFLYKVVDWWGLPGLMYARNALIFFPMIPVYIWLVRRRIAPWTALYLFLLPTMFLAFYLYYAFERPQAFSFFLVAMLAILLERLRRVCGQGRFDLSYWAVPLTMALWSNLHAGFIIGSAVIGIYALAVALDYLIKRIRGQEANARALGVFLTVALLGIVATGANPNGFSVSTTYFVGLMRMALRDMSGYISMFAAKVTSSGGGAQVVSGAGSWVTQTVLEYKPLSYFYLDLEYKWLGFYWAFTALLYLAMLAKYIVRRSFDVAEFLTVTLIVTFANMYARGLLFSLAIMPFYFAKCVVELKHEAGQWGKRALRTVLALLLVLSVAFGTYLHKEIPGAYVPGFPEEWVSPWFPAPVVSFLNAVEIAPPLYNYYSWGGYFIWYLYPKYKVFVDGRAIDDRSVANADIILKAQGDWRMNLNAFGINVIAIPVIFRESGHIVPLAVELVDDPDWSLVLLQTNGAVFVRNVPKNYNVIGRYGIDKSAIYRHIIMIEDIMLGAYPNYYVYNLEKATALMELGYYKEAKALFERFPQYAPERLEQLRQMGY